MDRFILFIVTLHEKIHELEEKRISLVDEMKKKETPAEERERLLKQVEITCLVKTVIF